MVDDMKLVVFLVPFVKYVLNASKDPKSEADCLWIWHTHLLSFHFVWPPLASAKNNSCLSQAQHIHAV